MTLKTVKYCSHKAPLSCVNTTPRSTVILCLQDSALVAQPLCPDSEEVQPVEISYIEATLCQWYQLNDCPTTNYYTFQYDDELLADPDVPLVTGDISGVFCKDCLATWVEEKVGNDVTLVDGGPGIINLINEHGCVFSFPGELAGACPIAQVSTLAQLIEALDNTLNIIVCGLITLTDDLTVNTEVTFQFGGRIVTDGNVLTLNQAVNAGMYQIFDTTTGNVVLSNNAADKIYPEWWGAVGDGIIEDTTAVEEAFIAAGLTGIPAWCSKTYLVSEADLVSNLIIDGEGTFVKQASTATYALATTGAGPYTDITIRNISVDGNKANNTAGGCIVIKGTNLLIENCYFYNSSNACINAAYILGGGNIRILNNRFLNAGEQNGWGAIAITGGNTIMVANNIIECTDASQAYGIDVEPNTGTPATGIGNISILNNIIRGGNLRIDGANITGNGVIDTIVIMGNTIDARNSYPTGFANETPVYLRNTNNLTLKTNTIFNYGGFGTNLQLGVALQSTNSRFDISDNYFVVVSPAGTTQIIRCLGSNNSYGRISNNLFSSVGVQVVATAIYAFSATEGDHLQVYGNRSLGTGVTNLVQIGDTNSFYEIGVKKGVTGSRPSQSSINFGNMYLDTTLDADGLPIFWNGTIWIKADGTAA